MALRKEYGRLVGLTEKREEPGRRRERRTYGHVRSRAARRAVLERSRGRCEFCERDAPGVTDRGHPILEVDHVREIAKDGRDHPEQMIALCPNCHAVKTRGAGRRAMVEGLLEKVGGLHREALDEPDESAPGERTEASED
ncbi:HNH endonuclease [Actinocorallia herbida]|uniref:HNH endonuclease n=1 Tax=Actinocorallia herbida TaxID=58109 RepID=A0A3N1DD39_9ACTN|nr:HNH endonuclease signature motif containing protein [Actinocorallia herbida]ROO91068.1 HNH endonuclease [Actinocorallia herbida]